MKLVCQKNHLASLSYLRKKIEYQACKIQEKARSLFNDGRNGRGRKGTKIPVFSDIYDLAKKYRNGQNSEAEQLSAYEHMSNRSNVPNEGGNKFRNFVGREVVRQGAKPTIPTCCKQQQLLENEAVGRWMEIYKDGYDYKPKIKNVPNWIINWNIMCVVISEAI